MKNILKLNTKFYLLLGVLIMSTGIFAQQIVRNNFYIQNPYLINPALTGFHGEFSGYLNYKNQWQGLSGAPDVAQLGVHGPISPNMGMGAKASFQSVGIFRETIIDLTAAYWKEIHKGGVLSFGMSIGFAYSSINQDIVRAEDEIDQALYTGYQTESLINAGFGLHYDYKHFQLNVAVPSIYNPIDEVYFQLFNSEMSYDFELDSKWLIHPSVYYLRANPGFNQVDFTVMAEYDKLVFVQAGYRSIKSVFLGVGVTYSDVGIMYAYEINTANLSSVSSGSHELMLYFDLENPSSGYANKSYYKSHQNHRKFKKSKPPKN